MLKQTFTIKNKFGIHARPAAKIVNELAPYQSEITFIKDGIEANAKSILNILMLAAEYNSKLEVIIEGEDEKKALQKVDFLLNQQMDE